MKRYVAETGSDLVRRWLEEAAVATSRLSVVEVTSAVCRRTREEDVSVESRDLILNALNEDSASWYTIEVTPAVNMTATSLLRRHPLRAADAIQLASAMFLRERLLSEVSFAGFDERLNSVAIAEGLRLADASAIAGGSSGQ